jgi:hypothetical protein
MSQVMKSFTKFKSERLNSFKGLKSLYYSDKLQRIRIVVTKHNTTTTDEYPLTGPDALHIYDIDKIFNKIK